MPAFGRDGMLEAGRDFGGRRLCALAVRPAAPRQGADLALGKKVFADNCAVCHGPDGKGNREVGAPNLTDKIWLYGSDKATIMQGVTNGRGGVMPAWGGRLTSRRSRRWPSMSIPSAAERSDCAARDAPYRSTRPAPQRRAWRG